MSKGTVCENVENLVKSGARSWRRHKFSISLVGFKFECGTLAISACAVRCVDVVKEDDYCFEQTHLERRVAETEETRLHEPL